jgi:predicted Zn finger-like uncharacterized protein
MPVLAACSSCSAKVKVKDELLGKSVKCPKCGKSFKAAEGATETAALKSAATKPPPTKAAWDKEDEEKSAPWEKKTNSQKDKEETKPTKKKSKSRDDDEEDEDDAPKAKTRTKAKSKKAKDDDEDDEEASFRDLLDQTTLSDDIKKLIQNELGVRERGVWVGQPCPKIMTVRAIPKVLAGVFVITILSIIFSIGGGVALEIKNIFAYLAVGVLYLMAAAVITIVIPFMDRRKALATAYVITNKRCIVFNGAWFIRGSPESYYPDLVAHMRPMSSWIFGDGAGDLVFRSVTTITTTHHARGGTSTSVSTTYYGFLGIRHMHEVEERIRKALLRDDDDDD